MTFNELVDYCREHGISRAGDGRYHLFSWGEDCHQIVEVFIHSVDGREAKASDLVSIATAIDAEFTAIRHLKYFLSKMNVGQEIAYANVPFKRVDGGVEIDCDFVSFEDFDEFMETLFHYEAQDCAE